MFFMRKNTHILSRLSLVLLCSVTFTGCISTSFLRSDPEPRTQSASSSSSTSGSVESQNFPATSSSSLPADSTAPIRTGGSEITALMNDARYAWDLGNMERAENLYGQATKNPLLSQGEQNEAWQRYALSAAHNGRPNSALDALENWNTAVPGAENTVLWQDAWLSSMRNLSDAAKQDRAAQIWAQSTRSEDVRAMAAVLLMGRGWTGEQNMQAMPVMRAFYAKQDMLRKQNLERITSAEVQYITDTNLLDVNQRIIAAQDFTYPANIILLEDARRGLGLDPATLEKAKDPALYVDKALATNILTGQSVGAVTLSGNTPPSLALPAGVSAPTAQGVAQGVAQTAGQAIAHTAGMADMGLNPNNICLVLAVPHSGSVAAVSQKIRAGAEAAVGALGAQGRTVDLRHVDTAQANWVTQMQTLPLHCAVVGGPILAQNLTMAKSGGATAQRNFFAFLPSLDEQDEGTKAWRLFPSPQDQVDALIGFSRQMGIHDFGSFFPADTYGTRMNSAFANAVRAGGGNVRSEGYVGTGPAVWNKAVQSLLNPQIVNNKLLSTATFGATFMPESWKNMEGIMNSFMAHGETRQVLLGTTIWGQSLGTGPIAHAEKFSMAIFPAAFDAAKAPAALQSLGTTGSLDMWSALGYDFVQLGASLGLPNVAPASLMNTKLQVAQNIPWAMAPVLWNAQGIARQKLMMFTVSPAGVVPADVNVLMQRRTEALTQFEALKMTTQP